MDQKDLEKLGEAEERLAAALRWQEKSEECEAAVKGGYEALAAGRWPIWVLVYLGSQAGLTFLLFHRATGEDFFAALYAILSMQALLRLRPRWGALWIGAFAVLMAIPMITATRTDMATLIPMHRPSPVCPSPVFPA